MLTRSGGVLTHEDEWIDLVAAAKRFNTSTQAIKRLVKLEAVTARRDQVAESQGIWPVWTLVHVGSLDDWFGVTAREEHVRKIRATARPLTREQKIAISKVFIDSMERREAAQRRAQRGAGGASS